MVREPLDWRLGMSETKGFGWLHLTDLHVGIGADHFLWENHEQDVLDDLVQLHKECGPWDLLFFTGDLTQRGSQREFDAFTTRLEKVLKAVAALQDGKRPKLLPVPGNHDLQRPGKYSGPVGLAKQLPKDSGLREEFFSNPKADLRKAVLKAFKPWSKWWEGWLAKLPGATTGLLPGDYCWTAEIAGIKVGVVGLNTAALHLYDAPKETLTLDPRQLRTACGTTSKPWCKGLDVAFLLTHHPPNWLDHRGRDALASDINPPGAFAMHLFGHAHEGGFETTTVGAGPEKGSLLGRSLFGLEWLSEQQEHERAMGYLAGRTWLVRNKRLFQLWPRAGKKLPGGGWQVVADSDHYRLVREATQVFQIGTSPLSASAVEGEDDSVDDGEAPDRTASPVLGWTLINTDYLSQHAAPLTELRLERYFNGARPLWDTAQDERVPRRGAVKSAVNEVRFSHEYGGRTVVLLGGAGGEGKSTVLLQAAADLVRKYGFTAVWRKSGHVGLSAEEIASLPPGKWLVVTDDADQVSVALQRSHQLLVEAGRHDVHLLLGARDTDWRHVRGNDYTWGEDLELVELGRLDEDDARLVVRAWKATGHMGALNPEKSEWEHAASLVAASQVRAAKSTVGTFFGGVLALRFSPDGLVDHVRDLMGRLGKMPVGTCGQSLRDALVYAAILDAVEIDGIQEAVLATLLGVPPDRLRTEVVRQLGSEAATTSGGSQVRTRHIDIARAVVGVVLSSDTDDDLGEIYNKVISTAIRERRNVPGVWRGWLRDVAHIGPRLVLGLKGLGMDKPALLAVGVRAAQGAIVAGPTRIDYRVTLARTWRAGGENGKASEVLRAMAPNVDESEDRGESIRGFWYEWSVCEGVQGRYAEDVLLAAYSISDFLNPVPVSRDNAKLALAGLGSAFAKLASSLDADVFIAGLRAAVILGEPTYLIPLHRDAGAERRFSKLRKTADELDAPRGGPAQAYAWLADAVAAAEHATTDEELLALLQDGEFRFEALKSQLRSLTGKPKRRRRGAATRNSR
jgi:hypothetical protein